MVYKEVQSAMEKVKLKFKFHDPNAAAVTAAFLKKLFIEVNAPAVNAACRKAVADVAADMETM